MNDTVNVGTVIANQFLTRTTLSTTNTFDNVNILGEANIGYNAYVGQDLFVKHNEFISNNLYINKKLLFGIDISNNIDPWAYFAGNQYNIGLNTSKPSTVFHVTGNNTNILTVDTQSAIIRNIIGQNVNKKGVVIEAEDTFSNIYFYNDNTTNINNVANAYLRYRKGGYLTLSTQTAIDLSASSITSHYGQGIMHFDQDNSLISTPGNLLFNSQNVFINSSNNFLFSYSPYGIPSSAVLMNDTGILLNTEKNIFVNTPAGTISTRYNKTGTVVISTNMTEISSNVVMSTSGIYKPIFGETLSVYDSSNSIYLLDAYDTSLSRTGNAITLIAADNSSNTQARIVAPNNMGLSLIGGVFPNDTSRSMGTIALSDISGNFVPSYMLLSGKDPAKYYSTVGINTYQPKTERYVLDVNGPTRIGNGEINTVTSVKFEITLMKFSKISPLTGISVGTWTTTASSPTYNYNDIILYTNNGGITWIQSDKGPAGLVTANANITCLYVYDVSFAIIGATQNQLLYTYNGGISWQSMIYNPNQPSKYRRTPTGPLISGYYNRTAKYVTITTSNDGNNYIIYLGYTYDNSGNIEQYNNNYQNSYTVLKSAFKNNSNVNLIPVNDPLRPALQSLESQASVISYIDSDCSNNYIFFVGSQIYQNSVAAADTIHYAHNPVGYTFNNIYVYNDNNAIAVGKNIISYATNATVIGEDNTKNPWTDVVFPNIGLNISNINLRSVYIYDLSRAVAVGDKGVFIYSNNWASGIWENVPSSIINTSGIGDRLTSENLRGIHMYDINSFVIANNNQSYSKNSQLGLSQIMYCYFPNLYNRVNNNVLDVSGNMIMSGDININDSGQIYSNNPSFNILNNKIVKEIYLGSSTANTAINGNLYVGNDLSLNSRLFLYGDSSFNSNLGMMGNITLFNNRTVYSNYYDVNRSFLSSGNIIFGYDASNISFGSNVAGGKTLNIGGWGNSAGGIGSTAPLKTITPGNIYIGATGDNVVIYGNTKIVSITQSNYMIPLLNINMAQNSPTIANSGGARIIKGNEGGLVGLAIKDLSNNYQGYIAVSSDTSGYYFKATGSDNRVNLNVGSLQWPNGPPTSLNISNNIQNGIMVLTKDTNTQNNADYAITVKPIDISNVFLRDGTSTSTNTYQQIATNVGVSGDLTLLLNNRLFVYCDASINSRLLVYSDVSFSRRLFISDDVSMNNNLYVANSVCIDTSGNQSLYNLDVSGTNNFRGTVNAINLIDNSVLMTSTPTIDFSSNFCNKWMQNVSAPSTTWSSIAMSSCGQFQTALVSSAVTSISGIYLSNDYGVNWAQISYSQISTGGIGYAWNSIAMSASGQYQVAAAGSYLYTSQNYGISWTIVNSKLSNGTNFFFDGTIFSVAISSNGNFITAASATSTSINIYTSVNNGINFQFQYSLTSLAIIIGQKGYNNNNIISVAMSSTGQYQICSFNVTLLNLPANNITLFVSNNYGQTWRGISTLPYSDLLNCVSISSSGQYMCIGRSSTNNTSYNLLVSTNYGATFTVVGKPYSSNNNYQWTSISMSANGEYITAVSSYSGGGNNSMLSSVDYGSTWNIGTASSAAWSCVAMSANAQYITSVVNGGYIFNSVTPYVNLSISNNLIVYRDCSFNARVFIGGPIFQF